MSAATRALAIPGRGAIVAAMRVTPACLIALLLAGCRPAAPAGPAPHQIRLVGAGVALPFTAAAAEALMRAVPDAIAPLVQADGSGSGIARFCGGLGAAHPDLVAATRAMTAAETARCAANGVAHVAAVPFGWSALVLVTRRDTPPLAPTRDQLARAATGDATTWAAIDPALPDLSIALHGPTPRPALADGLFGGLLATAGPVRRDGRYVAHGAAADLVAQAVAAQPGSVGILGYADALRHADTLRMLTLDGVAPDAASIAARRYPARLPLVLLVKAGEAPAVPALPALLRLFAQGLAPGGAFARAGLVPLAPAARAAAVARLDRLADGSAAQL